VQADAGEKPWSEKIGDNLMKTLTLPNIQTTLAATRKRGEVKQIAASYGIHPNHAGAWAREKERVAPGGVWWNRCLKWLSAESEATALSVLGCWILQLFALRLEQTGRTLSRNERQVAALRAMRLINQLIEAEFAACSERQRVDYLLVRIGYNLGKLFLPEKKSV
jgi:hypothetical protein